jgi:hypothetical protein
MFGAAGRHRQPCLAAVNIPGFVVLLLNLAGYPADPFVVMPVRAGDTFLRPPTG